MTKRPDVEPVAIGELLQSAVGRSDAEILLAEVLSKPRSWLLAHADEPIGLGHQAHFFELVRQRQSGAPIAYLTGRREFWSLSLQVTPAVLIPRPDTELLVELALARLPKDRVTNVLDLGTGSGAIAIAIASERPHAKVLAIDSSADALAVASGNARRLNLTNMRFVRSNWFTALTGLRFDLIAANPPYIAAGDPHLGQGDLAHEPQAALVSGADGLADLRQIIAAAPQHLRPTGQLLVEHGYDQQPAVTELFNTAGLCAIEQHQDLAGHGRCVSGTCSTTEARWGTADSVTGESSDKAASSGSSKPT